MAALMRTCGRELTLLSRTETLYASVINKQYREYARRYSRKPVRIITADEEKREFIDKKVAFRDKIQDFDRRDPVLSNLTQSKDLASLKSIPRINKALVDNDMTQDKERNNPRPGGYTKNKPVESNYAKKPDWKNDQKGKKFTKDKVMSKHGDKNKTKQKTNTQISYGKSTPKVLHPVQERFFSGLKYIDLGSNDKKVSVLIRAARSKKLRENDRIILLEGSRFISDALQAGGKPKSLYFKDVDALQRLPAEHLQDVPIYKCEERHLNRWSEITSVPDVMALFHMPEDGEVFLKPRTTIPLTIILDQIRDPGNMGTIIRSAAAVGCERIVAMQDCVDLWEPKVLRSGASCHFRVPFHRNITWKYVENYIPVGARIYLADKRRPTDKRVAKYVDPEDEDNVMDTLGKDENDYESDPESDLILNTSFDNSRLVRKYQHAPLPVSSFFDINYSRNEHTVLVIGGETRGVSLEAHKLAYDMYGQCIMIPMTNGVESLNAAVAGSVVMFEIYKQLGMQTTVGDLSDQTDVSASDEESSSETMCASAYGEHTSPASETVRASAYGEHTSSAYGEHTSPASETVGTSAYGEHTSLGSETVGASAYGESVTEQSDVSASGEEVEILSESTGLPASGEERDELISESACETASGEEAGSNATGVPESGEGTMPESTGGESMKSAPYKETENQGVWKKFFMNIVK